MSKSRVSGASRALSAVRSFPDRHPVLATVPGVLAFGLIAAAVPPYLKLIEARKAAMSEGKAVLVDKATGCEFMVTGSSSHAPRLGVDGKQVCGR